MRQLAIEDLERLRDELQELAEIADCVSEDTVFELLDSAAEKVRKAIRLLEGGDL